jgi:S1-C subfamily serine protease
MAARARKGLDREKIAAAVGRFPRRGGQGVIVPGKLIVTAAHVIGRRDWDVDEHYLEDLDIGGRRFKVEVYAVDPLSDVAILGVPDTMRFEDASLFESFLDSIRPVPICTADFPIGEPISVFIRTHRGQWVEGHARQPRLHASTLWIEAGEGILGGTSGGPVVTTDGRLIGVVSTAGGEVGQPHRDVTMPRLHLTAPGYLVRQMLDPHRELRELRRQIRKEETKADR